DVFFDFQTGGYIHSPTCLVAAQVELVINQVIPRNAANNSRGTEPTPLLSKGHLTSEIRHGIPRLNAGYSDAIPINTAVTACARSFDGETHMGIASDRHPAELHVS